MPNMRSPAKRVTIPPEWVENESQNPVAILDPAKTKRRMLPRKLSLHNRQRLNDFARALDPRAFPPKEVQVAQPPLKDESFANDPGLLQRLARQEQLEEYYDNIREYGKEQAENNIGLSGELLQWYLHYSTRLDQNVTGFQSGHPAILRSLLLFEAMFEGKTPHYEFNKYITRPNTWTPFELGNGWAVKQVIGSGSYGVAFMFEQKLGSEYFRMAVKWNRWDSSFFGDYNNEALAATRLWRVGCRNIPEVYDWTVIYPTPPAQTSGYFMTAFEFCEHGDLLELVEHLQDIEQQIPEPFIWHIFHSLAKVLAYCLRGTLEPDPLDDWETIAHLDMKTNNIFLGDPDPSDNQHYPSIKVGDWGMAFAEPQGHLAADSRSFKGDTYWREVGTRKYLPPEADNGVYLPDSNVFGGSFKDVYTVGVVMTEIFHAAALHGLYTKRLRNLIALCRHPDSYQRIDPYRLYLETKVVNDAYKKEMDHLADVSAASALPDQRLREIVPYSGRILYRKEHRKGRHGLVFGSITTAPIITQDLPSVPNSLPHPYPQIVRDFTKPPLQRQFWGDLPKLRPSPVRPNPAFVPPNAQVESVPIMLSQTDISQTFPPLLENPTSNLQQIGSLPAAPEWPTEEDLADDFRRMIGELMLRSSSRFRKRQQRITDFLQTQDSPLAPIQLPNYDNNNIETGALNALNEAGLNRRRMVTLIDPRLAASLQALNLMPAPEAITNDQGIAGPVPALWESTGSGQDWERAMGFSGPDMMEVDRPWEVTVQRPQEPSGQPKKGTAFQRKSRLPKLVSFSPKVQSGRVPRRSVDRLPKAPWRRP
ncbi:MAG: hypothetical protein M1814_005687 [Vezdaea aestivalis]|nr:MAG: hypothetical protein M1814_005687 [Vezdaea aestivalis]